jgi:formylglycine-generating enzyme required for sulfatase activity
MHGNVFEWCQAWYSASLPGGSVTDPQGPESGTFRALRGGSWGYSAWDCRSAFRFGLRPDARFGNFGFRVCLVPGPEPAAAATMTAPGEPLRSEGRAEHGRPWPLELVPIKPGSFLMGSLESEAGRSNDEGPQTRVTITREFSMGKYLVTQEQYEAVMGNNPSSFKGTPNLPVESVSWLDATNFCARLTERERQAGRLPEGKVYRLPTEAEWEYACRAGTTTRFSFGDDPQGTEVGKYAWYDGNSGRQTHPVGTKLPNPWGLYDMHGNVFEWCQAWYSDSLPGGSVTDPQGASSGTSRALRGGSWSYSARYCRSACRVGYWNRLWPVVHYRCLGFRVCLAGT